MSMELLIEGSLELTLHKHGHEFSDQKLNLQFYSLPARGGGACPRPTQPLVTLNHQA